MANLKFPDIKKVGSDRPKIITDKVFKQNGKKNIFETEKGNFYATGILIDGIDYPGNASSADKTKYAKEIANKIKNASKAKDLGDFDLIGKVDNKGSTIYLPITKVIKSAEFGGGGGGSGGGAADTEVTESLQCYYTSVIYNGSAQEWKSLKSGINQAILQKYAQYCDANVSLKNCLAAATKKESLSSWIENDPNVFWLTAEAIKKSKAGKKFSGKVYFHRDSTFMKAIYERRKRCMDHDKDLTKKDEGRKMIAPGSFSNDKWNPGDIWMSTLPLSTKDPFPAKEWEGKLGVNTCDWDALRGVVFHVADIGQTLGVSLKKLGSSAHVSEFNRPTRQQNITVEYQGFTFGQTGDFFSSADIYLYFKTSPGGEQAVQWRAFASTKSWQGEIKGSAAAGGKIGGGGTNYYIEKYFNQAIGSSSPKGHSWSEIRSPDWAEAFMLYKRYNEKQMKSKIKSGQIPPTITNQTEFNNLANSYINAKGRNTPDAFKFGKYMGLLLLDAVLKNKPNKKDPNTGNSWAIDTFRYAQSNIELSSYYIKVS